MKFKKNLYIGILIVMATLLLLILIELFWSSILPGDFLNFDNLRDYIFIVAYVVTTIIALMGFIENFAGSNIEYEVGFKSVLNFDAAKRSTLFHFPMTFSNSGKSTGIVKEITFNLIDDETKYEYYWDSFCYDDFMNGWTIRSSIRPIAVLPSNSYSDLITFVSTDSKVFKFAKDKSYVMEFSILISDVEGKLFRRYKWDPKTSTIAEMQKMDTYNSGNYNIDINLSESRAELDAIAGRR